MLLFTFLDDDNGSDSPPKLQKVSDSALPPPGHALHYISSKAMPPDRYKSLLVRDFKTLMTKVNDVKP